MNNRPAIPLKPVGNLIDHSGCMQRFILLALQKPTRVSEFSISYVKLVNSLIMKKIRAISFGLSDFLNSMEYAGYGDIIE